jgi:hypothetical protein
MFYSYVSDKIFLKGEIIQKSGKIELRFFNTALPLNALYYCMNWIISKGFQIYAPDKKTDGQTNGRSYEWSFIG